MADIRSVGYGSSAYQSLELLPCDDAITLLLARVTPSYDIIDHIIDRGATTLAVLEVPIDALLWA